MRVTPSDGAIPYEINTPPVEDYGRSSQKGMKFSNELTYQAIVLITPIINQTYNHLNKVIHQRTGIFFPTQQNSYSISHLLDTVTGQ